MCLLRLKRRVTSAKIHESTLVLLSIETLAGGPDNVQNKAAWNFKLGDGVFVLQSHEFKLVCIM
jgi:hypothetical protein